MVDNGLSNIFLIFDEYLAISQFIKQQETKIKKEFKSCFNNIILMGRSKGVYVMLNTQNSNTQNIPSYIRNQTQKLNIGIMKKDTSRMLFEEDIETYSHITKKDGIDFNIVFKQSNFTIPKRSIYSYKFPIIEEEI